MMNENYVIRLNIEREGCPVMDTSLSVGTSEELSRAKKQIGRILADFVQIAEENADSGAGSVGSEGGERADSPGGQERVDGIKGAVQLRCHACGNVFGKFLNQRQAACLCRCGQLIDLTGPLARYSYTCPSCGKYGYGRTNLEDAEINVRCVCGENLTLRWNPAGREYRN